MSGVLTINDITAQDFGSWLKLWDANNNGQRDEDVTAETWARLTNSIFPVHGLTARKGDELVGFLHYILHPVTGHINPACYMQDLYIDPSCRRQGTARKLVEHLTTIGKREKWSRLYWLAETSNQEAQALYKNLGLKLDFSFYVQPL